MSRPEPQPWPADRDPSELPTMINLDWKASVEEFFDALVPVVAILTGGKYEIVEYDSGGDNLLFEFRRRRVVP